MNINDYIDNEEDYQDGTTKAGKKIYIKNSELYDELLRWRDSGSTDDERRASEELGEMLLKIATRYMTHPNYIRYPLAIKQDIISASLIGMLNALPNYDFSKKNPFAYFTQICWSCAMDYLAKYYKLKNYKRNLLKEHITKQVEQGISVVSGAKYLKMLNDLTPMGNKEDETMMENQEFIDSLMLSNNSNMEEEDEQYE